MPPTGRPRPDASTYDSVASWLEGDIDSAAVARPNPGRTETVHRLNRTEYQNAVRDLLDVEIDASKLLPADDQSYGFDNIAGVLKMSPTLLERYMSAAREVTRLAIGDPRDRAAGGHVPAQDGLRPVQTMWMDCPSARAGGRQSATPSRQTANTASKSWASACRNRRGPS